MRSKTKAKHIGVRLDQRLTKVYPHYSRSFLKQQIKKGNVLVNGAAKKPSYILKKDDKIAIDIIVPEKSALLPNPDIKLNIIYEDENVIVIDKPAGISVHPARPRQNDTLVNGLLAYYPAIKNVGDEPNLRPGIVHRLDKDTSGLMVIAKNNQAFNWLKKQFQERKVVKKYLALVHGQLKTEQGIINKEIGRTKDFRKRTAIPLKEQKEAVTYYKVIKYFYKNHPPSTERERKKSACTLLEAEPKTGRTHQIRVHFASIGHPVVGDKLYGFKNLIPPACIAMLARRRCIAASGRSIAGRPEGLERQFLHASYLKFALPDGKMVELCSELPEDLQKIIDFLSQNTSK